ncbi:MAG: RNA polymerase sigma factor [Bacteroidetes bacterium]|nr:RNA polymerase sigma factor [Bacteroidota bacterium]MCB0846778.1 RNA polymerase sigma factor [Bacteroidota bacterium]MCB0854660.1 RNA polymerase sigma factor [Bacteroidota bacterium]
MSDRLVEQLLERCKQGDRIAQFELYKRYTKAMYNVAVRITRDVMEAEDVLQEAFVRAFRNLHSFKGDSTFGAWLKRIVINTSINHLKRKKADFVAIEDVKLDEYEPQPESFSSSKQTKRIHDAIMKLPEGYRVVFSLYLIEGYDHKEIGKILNISEATSKSQYSRAKKKLRNMLGDIAPAALMARSG